MEARKTKLVVIAGILSSGKTTLVEELEREGFRVVRGAARSIIDEGLASGKTMEEIRGHELLFQRQVLARYIEYEHRYFYPLGLAPFAHHISFLVASRRQRTVYISV